MSNARLFAFGVAGIALLGLIGVLAVALRFGEPAREPLAPAPAVAPTPTPADASATAPPAALPAPARQVSPIRLRPVAPAASPWEQVPIAARPYDLGPALARPVIAALDAARAQMAPCFEEEDRALAHGAGPSFDPKDPPTGPAVLVLRMESRQGALDVVDAEIDYLGTSTQALAKCCQQVVRGWPVPAPLAVPGHRYRLKYLLD